MTFNSRRVFKEYKQQLIDNSEDATTLPVNIIVCCPMDGEIVAKLSVGNDVFDIVFSDDTDAISELLLWLESSIESDSGKPLVLDDGWQKYFLNLSSMQEDGTLLFEFLRQFYSGSGVYCKNRVVKIQFITAMYDCLKYLMNIECDDKNSDSFYNYDSCSDDVIKLDLTKLETWLRSNNTLDAQ